MNLGYLINRAAEWYPDNVAVAWQGKHYTFREINDNSNRLANALLKSGITRGDRVVILASNCPEYIEADFAIYKAGSIRVALNPRIAPHEVAFIINDCEANTLIVTDDQLGVINQIRPSLATVKNYICISGSAADMIDYHSLIKEQSSLPPDVDIAESDMAQLFYTGGTTGVPKGAMLTHESNIAISLNMIGETYRLTSSDAILSIATLAHGNGYRTLPAWLVGARHILMNAFEPEAVLETIEKEGATIIATVPATLQRLYTYPGLSSYNLSSLRIITYGAAPMPVEKLKEALRVFGKRLCQLYGQGEAPVTITYLPPEEHTLEGTEEEVGRLASAGRAYISVEVKVVDSQGKDVRPGDEAGEIVVRSRHVMKGYWNNPEATKEALRDGWLHTGDLARIDEKGYIYIVGRAKDMIISGGYNVFAREVEEVISSHPAIADVAVIGVPDDQWGEAVKAVVVLKPRMSAGEKEIIDYCRDKLTSYKKPKSVDFIAELPRTSLGKVLKRQLRSKYWADQERQVH